MKYAIPGLLLLMPATAFATWGIERGSALDWSRYDTQWQLEGAATPQMTSIDRLGFTVTEPAGSWFYSGLSFGYMEFHQPDNAALAGLSPNGGYLGIVLGSRLWENDYFQINAQLDYTYHRLEDDASGREVKLSWTTTTGRLGFAFDVWRIRFSVGAYQSSVDGEQEFSGTLTTTTAFELAEEDTGLYGGLGFYTDDNGGRISLHYQSGAREGYMLTFSRGF